MHYMQPYGSTVLLLGTKQRFPCSHLGRAPGSRTMLVNRGLRTSQNGPSRTSTEQNALLIPKELMRMLMDKAERRRGGDRKGKALPRFCSLGYTS